MLPNFISTVDLTLHLVVIVGLSLRAFFSIMADCQHLVPRRR